MMRLKTVCVLFSVSLFVLVGSAWADKNYHVTMDASIKAGSVQLPAGEYDLVVDGSKARFTEMKTGKAFEVEAKIDDGAAKKFSITTIHSEVVDGAKRLKEICLGGTKTTVAFR